MSILGRFRHFESCVVLKGRKRKRLLHEKKTRETIRLCHSTKIRASVCVLVLKLEHRCRGRNVELFAYNDYVQLPASTLPTTLEIWVNVNTQSSVVSKISYFPSYDFSQNHSCDCLGYYKFEDLSHYDISCPV